LEKWIVENKNFILESTLSGSYLLKVIENVQEANYQGRIVYVFLESPDACIERIKVRVKLGGHHVPNEDVIRRYYRSKENFWKTYKNLADEWLVYFNSEIADSQRIAAGNKENYLIENERLFEKFINNVKL